MTTDNKGLSRRKLLKAGAIGVPAAGVLAFGGNAYSACFEEFAAGEAFIIGGHGRPFR